jgi:Family of unknown function (DUF6489)
MKITFDIDCTPEEARPFLGLPDVVPMQDALMKQMQSKLSENIRQMDPESLAKTWVPLTMQGWGELQKSFWGQMNASGFGAARSSSDEQPSPRHKATKRK